MIFNYNFEGRGVAYDSLLSKPELIYAQLAAGTMPQQGEAWSEADELTGGAGHLGAGARGTRGIGRQD